MLKRLGPVDAEQIWDILREIYADPQVPLGGVWTRALLARELLEGEGLGWMEEGSIQAFVLYRVVAAEAWEISILGTRPQGRRKGRMRQLLVGLLALKPQCINLWLEVHEKNFPALSLYLGLGGRITGRRPAYYRDGGAAILVSWEPPPESE